MERRLEHTVVERVYVESELAERGLETTESQANFSWVSLGDRDEAAVMEGLSERGVIVRAGAALGEEGRLRVTYGTRQENDRFLACPWTKSLLASIPADGISEPRRAAPATPSRGVSPGIGDLARRPARGSRLPPTVNRLPPGAIPAAVRQPPDLGAPR